LQDWTLGLFNKRATFLKAKMSTLEGQNDLLFKVFNIVLKAN